MQGGRHGGYGGEAHVSEGTLRGGRGGELQTGEGKIVDMVGCRSATLFFRVTINIPYRAERGVCSSQFTCEYYAMLRYPFMLSLSFFYVVVQPCRLEPPLFLFGNHAM